MPKYFIAIIPPRIIYQEIVDFQKEIEKDYDAIHAQKAPPHITIIPPFDCIERKVEMLEQSISESFTQNHFKGTIRLTNFQRFESRTLFVDVEKNESFEKFCKNLKQLFLQQKIIKQREEKHFFVPHITLANKDINKRDFKTLWSVFSKKQYQNSFDLTHLSILELKGNRWFVKKEITFDDPCM